MPCWWGLQTSGGLDFLRTLLCKAAGFGLMLSSLNSIPRTDMIGIGSVSSLRKILRVVTTPGLSRSPQQTGERICHDCRESGQHAAGYRGAARGGQRRCRTSVRRENMLYWVQTDPVHAGAVGANHYRPVTANLARQLDRLVSYLYLSV